MIITGYGSFGYKHSVLYYITICVLVVNNYVSVKKMKNEEECTSYPCLIFYDDFQTFDFSVWEHVISTAATGNNEFQYYTNNRSNSYVKNGTLYLKPTLTNDTFSDTFLTNGTLNLWGSTSYAQCTTQSPESCEKKGTPTNIINPIQSAAVRTRSFSFKYGKLEVRAKCSRGDWLWPAVWLIPKYNEYGSWPASGEIDLLESRGNDQLLLHSNKSKTQVGNHWVQQGLHWGPFTSLKEHGKTNAESILKKGSFADDYHIFSLVWTKEGMEFSLDNKSTLNISRTNESFWDVGNFARVDPELHNPWFYGNKMAPFDKEFLIILNVAVGGTNRYFEDEFEPDKPWKNEPHSAQAFKDFWEARDQWLPTWKGDETALKIDYVKVWKLQPSEEEEEED